MLNRKGVKKMRSQKHLIVRSIRIILLIVVTFSGFGFLECGPKERSANQNTNSNANIAPKTTEEKIADFRREAAKYRHRIENGILRFITLKRELKKQGRLTATQDLALNETLTKLNDAVDNIGRLLASTSLVSLDSAEGKLDEVANLAIELGNSIASFSPKESAETIQTVTSGISTAISGLRLILATAKKEFGNG
jgi:hypothetical protein